MSWVEQVASNPDWMPIEFLSAYNSSKYGIDKYGMKKYGKGSGTGVWIEQGIGEVSWQKH